MTVLIVAVSGGAGANQPQTPGTQKPAPPNTAWIASKVALAFLPDFASGKAPQKVSDVPSPDSSDVNSEVTWDVVEPAAAIQQQYSLGMDGLQAGNPAPYLALLAPDYVQPGADKSKTAKQLTEMLARNHCDAAAFHILEASMERADHLKLRVWQQITFSSKDTPPTPVTTAPGKTHTINHSGKMTVTQIVQQEWVQSGIAWHLRRAETVQQKWEMVY